MQRKNEKGEWPAPPAAKKSGDSDAASVSTTSTSRGSVASSSSSLGLSNSDVGRLIGTKGANAKRFEALFNVKVDIKRSQQSTDGSRLVEVRGKNAQSVSSAVEAVKTFLQTGVAPWTVTTKRQSLSVPKRSLVEILDNKAVIGRETNTSITIASRAERGESDMVRITVQGQQDDDIAQAIKALDDIACVHWSAITHPDQCYLQMKLRDGERNIVKPLLRNIEYDRYVTIYLPTSYHPYLVVVGRSEEAVSMALADIERDLDAAEVTRKQRQENSQRKR